LAAIVLVARHNAAGGDSVTILSGGRLYAHADLRLDRVIDVPGPLGLTRVEIRAGRVRVARDPGPRQLCVRQGWLAPGQAALCLPNQVAVYRGSAAYDSLNY
ncbi:MAG: NusG domain II-containing protein, partial [Thiobacillaceae bacterium]|nr:NusG domain II-containing protein [Thiobacillaceae bacterium]